MAREKKGREITEIVAETVSRMQALGVWREEYDTTVKIYAEMLQQYEILTERLQKSGYAVQTKAGQGGMKKSPLVAALEALRKDIITYSDRLCLNPKAMESLGQKPPPKQSAIGQALQSFHGSKAV